MSRETDFDTISTSRAVTVIVPKYRTSVKHCLGIFLAHAHVGFGRFVHDESASSRQAFS